jgi:hypothetical protein
LTDEQKSVLKRNYIVGNLFQTKGVNKMSALLLEFAKFHFPVEIAEIESIHNEEYQKQRQVIQENIDKILSKIDEMKEVA